MGKTLLILLVLSLPALAQTSPDGSFSVRHLKKADFSLNSDQMRDAETIYRTACSVVQHEFLSGAAGELHLHYWDPNVFEQGVVLLAVDQSLTPDVVRRLGMRAVRYSSATVDVSGLR